MTDETPTAPPEANPQPIPGGHRFELTDEHWILQIDGSTLCIETLPPDPPRAFWLSVVVIALLLIGLTLAQFYSWGWWLAIAGVAAALVGVVASHFGGSEHVPRRIEISPEGTMFTREGETVGIGVLQSKVPDKPQSVTWEGGTLSMRFSTETAAISVPVELGDYFVGVIQSFDPSNPSRIPGALRGSARAAVVPPSRAKLLYGIVGSWWLLVVVEEIVRALAGTVDSLLFKLGSAAIFVFVALCGALMSMFALSGYTVEQYIGNTKGVLEVGRKAWLGSIVLLWLAAIWFFGNWQVPPDAPTIRTVAWVLQGSLVVYLAILFGVASIWSRRRMAQIDEQIDEQILERTDGQADVWDSGVSLDFDSAETSAEEREREVVEQHESS